MRSAIKLVCTPASAPNDVREVILPLASILHIVIGSDTATVTLNNGAQLIAGIDKNERRLLNTNQQFNWYYLQEMTRGPLHHLADEYLDHN